MPTVDDVSRILTNMDPDKYSAAVSYIYYLADIPISAASGRVTKNEQRERQKRFAEKTAGKINVDERAIEDLRMRSMI